MEGLTDKQQAVLVLISVVLIAVGSANITLAPDYWYIGVILDLLGAIGFGVKEALGGKQS